MTNELLSGSGGGGGGKGGQSQQQAFYTPSTAADSLNSIAYANVIDVLCEGEIQGLVDGISSIYLNNTPLYSNGNYNFKNVSVATRNGTQNQTYIPGDTSAPISGTQGIYSEISVGIVVEYGVPLVRTITDPSVKFVNITLTFPALQEQTTKGDVIGSSVQVKILTQQANSSSYVAQLVKSIVGRTGDAYQVSYRIDTSNAVFPLNIKVQRETPNATTTGVVNAFQWTSYTLVKTARLSYPNTAYVALRIDAEQFSSIPTRSYLIKGLKVRIPNNATVEPTTGALIYSGAWNGVFAAAAYTTDPCWCLFDLLTSRRYGFGDYILTDADKANTGNFTAENLDKFAFYAASQYCSALNTRSGTTDDYGVNGKHGVPDGYGNYEPRFSLNVNIQTETEAYQLINDLASVFRGMPYWSAGSITVTQDAPTSPSYIFSEANVTESGFSYSGSSQKTRSTVALVKYFDVTRRDYLFEAVEDRRAISKYGVTQKSIEAFGCTSRGQARRLGEWLLASENLDTEVVTFTTSMDAGIAVRPGAVIAIADSMRSGSRRGGRIKAATLSSVQIDSTNGIISTNSPTVAVVMPTGLVEKRTVTNVSGDLLTVSPNFSVIPQVNAVWTYETTDIQLSTWRVISIVEQNGIEYTISALLYNASKYDSVERGTPLVFSDVSNLNVPPSAPTSFSASENIYTANGLVRAQLITTWKAAELAVRYQVRYRKDGGNWTTTNTSGPSFDLPDITNGVYDFSISSLASNGLASIDALSGSITTVGKTAPPSNVTNFAYTIDSTTGLVFSWTGITDVDFSTYEIRRGSINDAWAACTLVTQVNATTYKLGALDPGSYTYRIKAVDSIGIYSLVDASSSIVVYTPNPVTAISASATSSGVNIRWTAPVITTFAIKQYKITYGDTFATSLLATTSSTSSVTIAGDWVGQRTFWVTATDLAEKTSTPASVSFTIVQSTAPVLSGNFDKYDYVLKWVAGFSTITPSQWVIRYGTSFATGTEAISPVSGTSTSAKLTPSTTNAWATTGSVKIWVAPYWSATNTYGTAGSLDVTISKYAAPVVTAVSKSTGTITLSWTVPAGGSLPIASYEVRYSELSVSNPNPTWASTANYKFTVYATSKLLSGIISYKTYRFFVAAKDATGLIGTPSTGV